MNRGSVAYVELSYEATDCFNEAPIHESGKWVRQGDLTGDPGCFNEAPIHESGKYRSTGARAETEGLASMRPRFMNRGSSSGILRR